MALTGGANDFGPDAAMAVIRFGFDTFNGGGVPEGGPATARIKFVFRGEELGTTACAVVGAGALFFELVIHVAIGGFRGGLAKDGELFRAETLLPISGLKLLGSGNLFGRAGRFFHGLGGVCGRVLRICTRADCGAKKKGEGEGD